MRLNFKWRNHEVLCVMHCGDPAELYVEECCDDVFWLLDTEGLNDLRIAARRAIRKEQEDFEYRRAA